MPPAPCSVLFAQRSRFVLVAGCSKALRYKAPEIPACGRQAEE